MGKKSVYLHDIPLDEAHAKFNGALQVAGLYDLLGVEEINLDQHAFGRILAEPVWAKISSPHYHAAAMDGFAVLAEYTDNATLATPLSLKFGPQVSYVDTGDVMPDDADAVIPIEAVEPLGTDENPSADPRNPEVIRIRAAVSPWSNVRVMGEDMVATQLVLPAGHRLRPVDLGAIAAAGHGSVAVARKPNVAVIPTGSELVEIGADVRPGDILEYNSLVLAAQIEAWGGTADRLEIVSDDVDQIKKIVSNASLNYDLVLLNAGSSAGAEDYSAQVVESLGELLVHGVAVRPGHPVILGMIHREDGRQVPIIGVPGYPVSAALTGEIFVQPLLARWLGRHPEGGEMINATLTRKIASPAGDDDYIRVTLGRVGERMLAAPLSRGAGVISSLVRADGLALLPRGSQGEEAGAQVTVKLYRSPRALEQTIFAIGSHDIALDLFAQQLSKANRRLTSANVGSLGGLVALGRGEAHLAGSHLLDPTSGEYNLAYLKEYLPEVPVKVMGLVLRQQGLIVQRKNPQGINSLKDLARDDIIFINRQRGAGTRVRLDYELEKLGIDINNIQGYNREEYTHLGLAAAVASGRADCGLGIAAAAHALDLDFVPLFEERYDLIIPLEFYDSTLLAPLIKLFDSKDLRAEIEKLPGYNTAPFGKTIATVE